MSNGASGTGQRLTSLWKAERNSSVKLRQEDDSFSKRSAYLVKNVDELLAIPDEEFLRYTPSQKSNLVARFAVNRGLMANSITPAPPKHLAYEFVGLAALLAEANFNAERLDLPVHRPIQENQLTSKSILEPGIYRNFGGRVGAGGYSFSEQDRLRARIVGREDSITEEVFRSKPLITTNEAYQLAAGWLRAIDVDVRELEKTNKVEVRQQIWLYGGKQVLTPIFQVRWGTWEEPKVDVILDGRTKKLNQLRQNDESFSRRPAELIKNLPELLAIPDDEFLR